MNFAEYKVLFWLNYTLFVRNLKGTLGYTCLTLKFHSTFCIYTKLDGTIPLPYVYFVSQHFTYPYVHPHNTIHIQWPPPLPWWPISEPKASTTLAMTTCTPKVNCHVNQMNYAPTISNCIIYMQFSGFHIFLFEGLLQDYVLLYLMLHDTIIL